jgi:two-component system, LytTR family, sensor kinase
MQRDAPVPPPASGPLGFPWRVWGLIAAFWTVMGVLESVKTYFAPSMGDEGRNWLRLLAANMPWWYAWLLLTPLVFALARRFPPWAPGKTVRHGALHFAAAAPLAVAHAAASSAAWWYLARPRGVGPLGETVRQIVAAYTMSGIMVYWALVGAYAAFDWHRRFRERELAAARLAVRAAQLEASATQSRLDALRMELNPHFLFNTLNSVAGLARRGDTDGAVRMLSTLGELLRVTLGQKEQEVALEQELDFLRRYLEIERVRFHDRLTVRVDVPDDLLRLPVPSLILQPLAENAVRHGVARSPGPGMVMVRAERRGDALVLEVRDTGAGFNGNGRGEGVGLANTRERLARLYGDRARLELENVPGGGARVAVTLPAGPEEDDGPGS